MDSATGSIYLGHPGLDRCHLIIWNTHFIYASSWSHALLPSFQRSMRLSGSSCTHMKRSSIDAMCVVHHGRVSHHIISPSSYAHRSRTTHSHKFPSETMRGATECSWWAVCHLAPPFHHSLIEWTPSCTRRPWWSEYWGHQQACLEIHLEAVIEQVGRSPWWPWLCELGGRDCASWEIHPKAVIEQVSRCGWRLWSKEFGDALGDRNRASFEMHMEAVILALWRGTWRPSSCEWRGTLGGCDPASLETHLDEMVVRDWRSTGRRSIWRW